MNKPRKLPIELSNMLQSLAAQESHETNTPVDTIQQKVADLRDSFHRMQKTDPASFKPGDLVRWQPHMKYTLFPAYDEPMVVVEVLPHASEVCVTHPSSTYFRTPCTLVLGTQRSKGFWCWHYDGRRFELAA